MRGRRRERGVGVEEGRLLPVAVARAMRSRSVEGGGRWAADGMEPWQKRQRQGQQRRDQGRRFGEGDEEAEGEGGGREQAGYAVRRDSDMAACAAKATAGSR